MKLIIRQLFILLFISSGFSCYAAMRKSDVPLPANGCKVGSLMYTHYLRTLYTGEDPVAGTITGYVYIYGSDVAVSCYTNETKFIGPNPNNPNTTYVGCDLNKTSWEQGTNYLSYNFTVNCPIDNSIFFLILAVSIVAVVSLRKRNS